MHKLPGRKAKVYGPECINIGCDRSTTLVSKTKFRPVCSKCKKAQEGKGVYGEGVTPLKKSHCENRDGRLGWKCTYSLPWEIKRRTAHHLQIDHIDGDPYNNEPDNIQTLCASCHSIKSILNGDVNAHRNNHKKCKQNQ
jgi:hypothetical protein